MIGLLITAIVLFIIYALVIWVMGKIPFPADFPVWVIHVILALIIVIILIRLLLGLPGLTTSLLR